MLKNIFHVLNLQKKLSQGLDNIVTVRYFMSAAFIELEVLRGASVVAPIVPNTTRKVMAMKLVKENRLMSSSKTDIFKKGKW